VRVPLNVALSSRMPASVLRTHAICEAGQHVMTRALRLRAGGPADAAGGGQRAEVPRGLLGGEVDRGAGRVRGHAGRGLQHRLAAEEVRFVELILHAG
jgi:hypothetical protein